MMHPDFCYSHDLANNCTLIKWGESGYYRTDYPNGRYTTEIINEMNSNLEVTPKMRMAMEICSMVAQDKPDLDWDVHYQMIMEGERK